MRTYSVHHKQPHPVPTADYADGAVFVREGFAVFAFLFHIFWFAYRGMWIVLVAYLVVSMAMSALVQAVGLDPLSGLAVVTAVNLLVGFEANDLRRWTLARKGYELIAIVRARSLVEAEEKYFSWVLEHRDSDDIGGDVGDRGQRVDPSSRPGVMSFASRKPQAEDDEVVGLFPRPEGSV